MTDRASQGFRRRRLAAELRRLREHAGLTGDEAAAQLGWSASKISRIETHQVGVKSADLQRLLDLYDVPPGRRADLQAIAGEATQGSELDSVAARLPTDYADYLAAEQAATTIWNWDPLVIPGLLQTDGYAGAVMAGYQAMFRLPPADRERRVEVRRMRQRVLTRPSPVELTVVIDESVLHRRYGDVAVMRDQLHNLAGAAQRPNVEVRVLALSAEHPIGTGAFSLMQFPREHGLPLNDRVTVEHLTGNYYLEDEEQTYQYRVSFEALLEQALSAARSQELIESAASAVWG